MARGFNRIAQFLRIYDEKKYQTLDEIGRFCKSKMDEYAAVDTGYMKSRNDYKVTKYFKQKLELKNDCEYSGYIEFGTYKMMAQPFMRPAVFNHLSEIRAIARGVFDDL
jgi:HK97 gp10 family phage protein